MLTDTPTAQSLTISEPRITPERFAKLLADRNSPVGSQAEDVYDTLLREGVEPAFALAQFRVESQYGTSGWAQETGSWGNMLWDTFLTTHASGKLTKTDSNGRRYTFATYTNYSDAITDYCRYIHWYVDQYGLVTIYAATGRWLGLSRTGDAGHLSYVTTVVDDMIAYQFPPGVFYESGDAMIYAGASIDRAGGARLTKTLYVKRDTPLYRGTRVNEAGEPQDLLKKLNPGRDAAGRLIAGLNLFFLGPINGSWEWGAVVVGTTMADPAGTVVYLHKPDKTQVKSV